MGDKKLFILYICHHDCWWPGNTRSQGIRSNGIDLILTEYNDLNTRKVKNMNIFSTLSIVPHRVNEITFPFISMYHKYPYICPISLCFILINKEETHYIPQYNTSLQHFLMHKNSK